MSTNHVVIGGFRIHLDTASRSATMTAGRPHTLPYSYRRQTSGITSDAGLTATDQPAPTVASGAGAALRELLRAELNRQHETGTEGETGMTQADATSDWYDNSHLRVDSGSPDILRSLRTRHQPPQHEPWSTSAWLALTRDQMLRSTCIHETGHLLIGLQAGLPVREVHIAERKGTAGIAGHVSWGDGWSGPWVDYAVMMAAGEQAQMRWLKEEGLYTAQRGWAVEAHAWQDRQAVATSATSQSTPPVRLTFGQSGAGDYDWADLLLEADRRLGSCWGDLLRVAEVLDQSGYLSGTDAVRIANPNGDSW